MSFKVTRRSALKHSVFALGAGVAGSVAQAAVPAGRDPFDYEITRSEEEWREMLTEEEYRILRDGGTEQQYSHPLWEEKSAGTYHCKGCDLQVYASEQKYFPDKGWVFFTVGYPNSQMMAIDARSEMADVMVTEDQSRSELNEQAASFFIETHCRRCGSHLGHILPVEGRALHCINGASLVFNEAAA